MRISFKGFSGRSSFQYKRSVLYSRKDRRTTLCIEPFSENYSFAERDTQLSPDFMFSVIDYSICDYELKSGNNESYTMNIILKRESETKKEEE